MTITVISDVPTPKRRTIRQLRTTTQIVQDVQPSWMDSPGVKCKGITELFYASRSNVETARAKSVCTGADGKGCCLMLKQCKRYAMDHNELFGVWGGMSERDRQKVRKARRRHGGHIIDLEGVKFPEVMYVRKRQIIWVRRRNRAS